MAVPHVDTSELPPPPPVLDAKAARSVPYSQLSCQKPLWNHSKHFCFSLKQARFATDSSKTSAANAIHAAQVRRTFTEVQQQNLSDAGVFVGRCMTMCPSSEIDEREGMQTLSVGFEVRCFRVFFYTFLMFFWQKTKDYSINSRKRSSESWSRYILCLHLQLSDMFFLNLYYSIFEKKERCVKTYHRPSAADGPAIPEDVRPPPVLL